MASSPTSHQPNHQAALSWYLATFSPEPGRGYAVMNLPGAAAKYTRRTSPLTLEDVAAALDGTNTRRLEIGGSWHRFPLSIALVPQTRKGEARAIAWDVDTGGRQALERLLATCQRFGLQAFAQVGQSATHDGGHVWATFDALLPASMLADIGSRIAQVAGVEAEIWPRENDIRLPLMLHLQAPGGPKRFDLLLQSGLVIEGGDAWAALDDLRLLCQLNPPAMATAALDALPPLPAPQKRIKPRHRSEINPAHLGRVIDWYCGNFGLEEMLERAGAELRRGSLHHCPWHEDEHPSLAVWRHERTGRLVCKCYSTRSNCPAANGPYWDAFNVYCHLEGLEPGEAVKALALQYGLGRKRELKVEEGEPHPAPTPDAIALHQATIEGKRRELAQALARGALSQGVATIIRATPGMGKTHQAAALANELHRAGKRVAITAPSHDVAANEWLPRLEDGYYWQPKTAICTCHDRGELQRLGALGYHLPECKPDCPYERQRLERRGRQVVYQHNHLHLNDGRLLEEADVIIIDESPQSALLIEQPIRQGELQAYINRNPEDAASPLLAALVAAGERLPRNLADIRGKPLLGAISKALGGNLGEAIAKARLSPHAEPHPHPPEDVATATRQFLADLLEALAHDVDNPNPLLSWGRVDKGKWGWIVSQRRRLLAHQRAQFPEFRPAVIVLDGSANATITAKLFAPWEVVFRQIDAPLSPAVEIVQVSGTPSTRRIIAEPSRLQALGRSLAHLCNELGIALDGGVSYLGARQELGEMLGGDWLHYGGQRGSNALAAARAVAIIASPTAPPAAIERKALALWSDAQEGMDCSWHNPSGKPGAYIASDARLEAMNQLHGPEELRQSAHRVRPILSDEPITLIVASPWELAPLGLSPTKVVSELPHGNAKLMAGACDEYTRRRQSQEADRGGDGSLEGWQYISILENGIRIGIGVPHIPNGRNIASGNGKSPPLPASPKPEERGNREAPAHLERVPMYAGG